MGGGEGEREGGRGGEGEGKEDKGRENAKEGERREGGKLLFTYLYNSTMRLR